MMEPCAIMAFDPKKNRFRIHKTTIHMMGDPKYIHLLVNPEKKTVAIVAAEEGAAGKDAYRIKPQILESDNSYEIYSRIFLVELFKIVGGLSPERSYRVTGKVISSKKIAVYSLDTITPIEQ